MILPTKILLKAKSSEASGLGLYSRFLSPLRGDLPVLKETLNDHKIEEVDHSRPAHRHRRTPEMEIGCPEVDLLVDPQIHLINPTCQGWSTVSNPVFSISNFIHRTPSEAEPLLGLQPSFVELSPVDLLVYRNSRDDRTKR
jgi:hypothetical protein